MVVDVLLNTSITEARDFREELFAQLKAYADDDDDDDHGGESD